ncbi:MAG: hypothetical protein QXV01_10855 [Candidatus Bathyarchaeia archaeon]
MSEQELKSIRVSRSVWAVLMRLKFDWGVKTVDDVIRELLKRAGVVDEDAFEK